MSEQSSSQLLNAPVAISGTPVKQFTIMLHNRAGAFAAIVKLLAQQGIAVRGLSLQDSRDATLARLVVSNPPACEQWFMEKGIFFTSCDLVVCTIPQWDVQGVEVLELLMLAETNIDFAYTLLPNTKGEPLLAVHVEDYDFACSVLNQSGIGLISQEDLN